MMIRRFAGCVLLLAVLLAVPFLCRRREAALPPPGDDADTLVLVTAHNKSIRDEYEAAFRKHYREKYGKDVRMDFRTPGGTSDIVRYITDRFEAEFRRACEKKGIWKPEYAGEFSRPGTKYQEIRREFLASGTGIGIDLFAGGGTFDQSRMARAGYAVDGGVMKRHPEYFAKTAIPASFGGENLYDPQGRYYGVVLSTFGICYNTSRLAEFQDKRPPERWSDMAQPRFFNQLSLADPSKSGSANKCFEIILQQCMAEAGSPDAGWGSGLNLLKRIFANARNLTDSAGKVVRDVGAGDAVLGMAIDTYGFAEMAWSARKFNGKSRIVYVTPKGGTAVSADPVQLLRGAPNRIVAERFIDFLLSIEGQKLHVFKAGVPGGARKYTLSRPAIRQELYAEKYREFRFEPDYMPYRSGADFRYRPEWTGRYYSLLRILLKSLMISPHPELQEAWRAILAAGGPEAVPEAMKEFNALPFSYAEAAQAAQSLRIGPGHSAAEAAAVVRSWSDFAGNHYRKAAELARQKK